MNKEIDKILPVKYPAGTEVLLTSQSRPELSGVYHVAVVVDGRHYFDRITEEYCSASIGEIGYQLDPICAVEDGSREIVWSAVCVKACEPSLKQITGGENELNN